MLVVRLNYKTKDFKDMTDVQRVAMLKNWMPARLAHESKKKAYPDSPEEWVKLNSWEINSPQRLTLEEVHELEIVGIKLEIEGVDGTMLTKMTHREEKYGDVTSMELKTGQVVQITVPDIGILSINEVDYVVDGCTEELQTKLDEGWRILAVCPPNAQRRPDYILGRWKK